MRRAGRRSRQSVAWRGCGGGGGHRSGSAGGVNPDPTTPTRSASAASNGIDNSVYSGGKGHNSHQSNLESESESSCGEESRRRTAEAFMSGIQSAIQEKENIVNSTCGTPNVQGGIHGAVGISNEAGSAGLSKELVGEVDSVLSKLMSQLKQGDPSLIPLITNLQTSLKTAAVQMNANDQGMQQHNITPMNNPNRAGTNNKNDNRYDKNNKRIFEEDQNQQQTNKKQSPVVSELFGNECTYLSNMSGDGSGGGAAEMAQPLGGSKIPWKIRAARKRALKHHTTGMTKDEFAQIKQSLSQAAISCKILFFEKLNVEEFNAF